MGKNSLIKSTDKKKKASKPVEAAAKKATKKEAAKPAKVDKSKAPESKSASPTPKTPPAPKKSGRELVFEKFEPITPQPAPQAMPSVKADIPPAPPLITAADPAEAARIREVLFAQHRIEDVFAAAREPEKPRPPAATPPTAQASEARPVSEQSQAAPAAPEVQAEPGPARPAAQEVKPVVTTVDSGNGGDPVNRTIKYAAAGFVLLLVLLIGASIKNSGNYYIESKDNALEIWRGRFSPTGKAFFMVLHDVHPPQDLKTVYTREEIFPLAFKYYLDKADALLETADVPDYEGMTAYLNMARKYAITPDAHDAVTTRLNSIERMPLLYKADVAISRGTVESLEAALTYLRQAQRLTTDSAQAELVAQKIAAVEARQAALAAETEAAAQSAAQPQPQ